MFWDGSTVAGFSIDLNVRGTEILSEVPGLVASSILDIPIPFRTNEAIALPANLKPTKGLARPRATRAKRKPEQQGKKKG